MNSGAAEVFELSFDPMFVYTCAAGAKARVRHLIRNRYYDPHSGRFTAEDPIGFTSGLNFYTYVRNNPTDFVDPLGLKTPCYWAGKTRIGSWETQTRSPLSTWKFEDARVENDPTEVGEGVPYMTLVCAWVREYYIEVYRHVLYLDEYWCESDCPHLRWRWYGLHTQTTNFEGGPGGEEKTYTSMGVPVDIEPINVALCQTIPPAP